MHVAGFKPCNKRRKKRLVQTVRLMNRLRGSNKTLSLSTKVSSCSTLFGICESAIMEKEGNAEREGERVRESVRERRYQEGLPLLDFVAFIINENFRSSILTNG